MCISVSRDKPVVPYAVVPNPFSTVPVTTGCDSGYQPTNNDDADRMLSTYTHELFEIITDPLGNHHVDKGHVCMYVDVCIRRIVGMHLHVCMRRLIVFV